MPHLADFGVASSRDDTAGLTAVGTVVGTPGFMAPEQARGEAAGQAADVFALGATLLFAATGEGPYGRGAGDLLMVRAAQGKVRPIPRDLPTPLRHRLQAMLDPRPERRPSAAALVGGPAGTMVRRPVVRPPSSLARVGRGRGAGRQRARRRPARGHRRLRPRRRRRARPPPHQSCTALPYQPCGQATPAAGTDGRACLAGFEDYDEDAANGCEAADDGLPDEVPFPEGAAAMTGTIVPRDDVDTFAMDVGDGYQLLCDGSFTVTITAPAGMTIRLEVLDDGEVVDEVTSADGIPAQVTLGDPDCLFSDARTLTARVSPIGTDRTGDTYTIDRTGSF